MYIRDGGNKNNKNKLLANSHCPEPLSVGNHYAEREMDECGWKTCGGRQAENAGYFAFDAAFIQSGLAILEAAAQALLHILLGF